ncbi:hypothetical protein NK983_29650, partial [Salmonella enterica subsp. enterica serovar Typhimurium]|nr:hypothetical protein [Salmonella enterica subsp. enterica serovar Typhimurium]
TTGEQYYFSGVSEYYQGYEDGEHWTEGSAESTMTVQHLSAGRYHYNVTVTTDPATPTERFRVNVIQNVTLLQNFWIALLCLLVFPLYI